MAFYVFVIALVLTISFIYYSASRVINKNSDEQKSGIFAAANAAEPDPKKEEKIKIEEKGTQQQNTVKVSQSAPTFFDTQLLTAAIDWSKVSACLSSKSGCVCYGLSMERIVVPKESCELAVKNGWHRKKT